MQSVAADISFKELKLALFRDKINFSQFTIFQEKTWTITGTAFQVHAGIIGTSHFVEILHKGTSIFTEVLACNAEQGNADSAILLTNINAINNTILDNSATINYQIDFKLKKYNPYHTEITNWRVTQKNLQKGIYMEHFFNENNPALPPSRTLLSITTNQDTIAINTVHEYQEENTIVLTNSNISLP